MKRIVSLLAAMLILVACALPCFAETPGLTGAQVVSTRTETLDSGIVRTTTVYEYPAAARASTRRGSVHQELKYQGKLIASIYLNATFSYNGSTATATSASSSHSVASGWSYSGESVWCSGATAHLTATVSGLAKLPIDLTLTCSPSGVLS